MTRDTCIYHRTGDMCACKRLSGVRPNCSWWTRAHECLCHGKIGRQGILSN